MVDRWLEPDDEEFRCECGECEACCGDWEFGGSDEGCDIDYDMAADEYERQIEGCA